MQFINNALRSFATHYMANLGLAMHSATLELHFDVLVYSV